MCVTSSKLEYGHHNMFVTSSYYVLCHKSRCNANIVSIILTHFGAKPNPPYFSSQLIDFLKAIRKTYESGHMKESFDPRAALFVCNRWDLVKEKSEVKANAIRRLEFVWPGLSPAQMFFFSTTNTLTHLKAGKWGVL